MAQTEDTELRDLVIEALEKNGSLAKIRALLRANIFLAFEDECENLKQNESLDKILLLPGGKLCLSIIHDFLDFCNLRNTLFVYKSETRQGTEYTCESRNTVADKLNLKRPDQSKNEPVLLSLVNNILYASQKTVFKKDDKHNHVKRLNRNKNMYKGDQDCTYIVHEDSSTTTSHSQSDNSSDEKNKLDLRLSLDNSDTDTSSESLRGQTRSEYIPNKHVQENNRNDLNVTQSNPPSENYVKDTKILNNSSNESTSYVELKPFNSIDAILLNTTGLPFKETEENKQTSIQSSNSITSKIDTLSQIQTLKSTSESIKKELSNQDSKISLKNSPEVSNKNGEDTEYSYDFTSPPISGRKDSPEKQLQSPKSLHEDVANKTSNNSSSSSHKQNSFSSQSSVSISDVADLISEKSSYKQSYNSPNQLKILLNDKSIRSPNRDQSKMVSDDSGDFSESPIPSLSNLSLDIHSD